MTNPVFDPKQKNQFASSIVLSCTEFARRASNNWSETTMKPLIWLLMLFLAVPLVATQEKQEAANQEVSGTIKEVSINVRRLIIETTQHQEKTVSVEPETRILVDRREGTLEELKPGQSIRVVLPRESSKAILIEVT